MPSCSGVQTLVKPQKCCDLACDAESTQLKSCEDFDIKLEVKHIFLTPTWSADFYIYQLPESLGMRKILVHGIGCKRIYRPGLTFSAFSWICMELCRSQVQLTHLINGIASLKIICLETFVLLDTNYNDFLILNNFQISFKIMRSLGGIITLTKNL